MRERAKSCPSRLFPGEKGLNGSSVLLHSLLGCSASAPGSMMLDSQLLLRLLARLHVFPPLLLSNLRCRHMRSTHNTVAHSIGRPCHRTSSNSDLFFPTQRHSVSPLGELAADQKEAENSLSAWQQSLEAFCSLLHTFKKSPGCSETLQLMLNRFVGADKPGLFVFVSWLPGGGNIYYRYLSLIFKPSSKAPPAIFSCFFFYCSFFIVIKLQGLRCAAPFWVILSHFCLSNSC